MTLDYNSLNSNDEKFAFEAFGAFKDMYFKDDKYDFRPEYDGEPEYGCCDFGVKREYGYDEDKFDGFEKDLICGCAGDNTHPFKDDDKDYFDKHKQHDKCHEKWDDKFHDKWPDKWPCGCWEKEKKPSCHRSKCKCSCFSFCCRKDIRVCKEHKKCRPALFEEHCDKNKGPDKKCCEQNKHWDKGCMNAKKHCRPEVKVCSVCCKSVCRSCEYHH